MDERTQAEAYASADFAEPHQYCVDTCHRVHGPFSGHVLDLGCGPGDVLTRYARANPDAVFLGVDGAPVMLELASAALEDEGVAARVELAHHYLPSKELHTRRFDAIVSNSLLHHLNDPSVLWETIRLAGRSGARVFVMDLMRPDSEEEVDSMVSRYAMDAPPVLRRDFRASLHAAYRTDEVESQLAASGLELTVEAVTDRHFIVWGTLP